MEKQLEELSGIAAQAKTERQRIAEAGERTNDGMHQQAIRQESEWEEFFGSAKADWGALRTTFNEQLQLQAPATYWQSRAHITFQGAMWSLGTFVVISGSIISSIMVFGPGFLTRLVAIEDIGNLGILSLVSIPALTALWGLRHVARLFVTNFELSADAKLRETMATTFLALTKDLASGVGADERLMVLEALFRPPVATKAISVERWRH